MTGGSWIDLYLDAIAAERGATRNTLEAYNRDLQGFQAHCHTNGTDLKGAARPDIEGYLAHLEAEGLALATRARRLSAIRQFFRFLYLEGLRTDDPGAHIHGPRPGRSLPETLSEEEVEGLLAAARGGEATPKHIRDTALIELLYATGLRVSELVSLTAMTFSGDPQMILVRGKGGKERMVPLSEPARRGVRAWLETRAKAAPHMADSPWLFPARGGKKPISRQTVFLLMKTLAAQAGISPERVSPHVVRHAFATHLLANGADLRAIQMLLGHANLGTTEIYTHVASERARALVLEKHPMAKATPPAKA